jgi:hypothetical protein
MYQHRHERDDGQRLIPSSGTLPGHVLSMESRYVSEVMAAALFSMIGLLIVLIDCGSARDQVQATGRREDQGADEPAAYLDRDGVLRHAHLRVGGEQVRRGYAGMGGVADDAPLADVAATVKLEREEQIGDLRLLVGRSSTARRV